MIEARGFRVAVFTVLGRTFMNLKADCPFLTADRMIAQLKGQADAIIVEVHAEATSEKQALGWHLDGRVTAVIGTHTHVPTSDHRILPGGTGYLSDAGMCGDYDSVIGMQKDIPLQMFLHKRKFPKMTPAQGEATICASVVEIDNSTGLATNIYPIRIGGVLQPSAI